MQGPGLARGAVAVVGEEFPYGVVGRAGEALRKAGWLQGAAAA